MKSKEAIRNTILRYTDQIWGTKKIERLDLLIQMMIGTLTNELYLSQNKLNDLDTTLLEKIARKLTPEQHMAIRPAHTILQMKPIDPITLLSRSHMFKLEWMPDDFFIEKGDGIVFHPVSDAYLFNLNIDYLFYYKQLYSINSLNKKLIQQTQEQPTENAIWLGLDINQEVDNLEHLSFYLDFPHHSEIDELYEVLPYTKCFIGDKEIKLKAGFPVHSQENLTNTDIDILHLYNDHFLSINEAVYLKELVSESIPKELSLILNGDKALELPPRYWITLVLPSYFTQKHLSDAFIAVNAFPVSNKRLTNKTIIRDNLSGMNILPSDPGEKLLSIESVVDNRGRKLVQDRHIANNESGTYQLETTNRVFIEEYDLVECIEQLQDIIEDERAVFSGIDKEQVTEVLSALTNTEDKEVLKTGANDRIKNGEVSRLSVSSHDNISFVKVDYWLTFGDQLNNIPAGKLFDADKSGRLDGLIALSLCEVHGSKEFTDIQDIMSIDRYVFTSKDRIITEHNVVSFCESELGRAIESIEVKLDGKISPKPKEGIIRTIKIILTPSVGHSDLLYRKGVLKSLKTRLQQRSPDEFIYDIHINNSETVINK